MASQLREIKFEQLEKTVVCAWNVNSNTTQLEMSVLCSINSLYHHRPQAFEGEREECLVLTACRKYVSKSRQPHEWKSFTDMEIHLHVYSSLAPSYRIELDQCKKLTSTCIVSPFQLGKSVTFPVQISYKNWLLEASTMLTTATKIDKLTLGQS